MADKDSFKPVPGPASYDYPVLWNAFVDAVAEMTDPFGDSSGIRNLSLVFTVGANALTCNAKTRDGSAPAANNPAVVGMRNVTLATGNYFARKITAALSLVISSGSTLGHASATPSNTYWYLIDNAGALELAVSSTYFGESGLISTTAEGGAGAADSAIVMYSATARANVPFRRVDKTVDTQAVAGTWTAEPTEVSMGSILGTMATQNASAVAITGGTITGIALAGAELAYGEITAAVTVTATTSATANTVVSSGADTYDGTPVYVEFYAEDTRKGTSNISIILYDGATQLGVLGTSQAGLQGPVFAKRKITPSVGSHTYQVKAYVDGGSGSVQAGSGASGANMPAFCRVVKA